MMEQPPPQGDGTTSSNSSNSSNGHHGVSPSSSAAAASASSTTPSSSSSSASKPPQHPPREREQTTTTPSSTLELPEHFEPSDRDVIVGWARQNYHHGACFVFALLRSTDLVRSIDRSMSLSGCCRRGGHLGFVFSSVIRHSLTFSRPHHICLIHSPSICFFFLVLALVLAFSLFLSHSTMVLLLYYSGQPTITGIDCGPGATVSSGTVQDSQRCRDFGDLNDGATAISVGRRSGAKKSHHTAVVVYWA